VRTSNLCISSTRTMDPPDVFQQRLSDGSRPTWCRAMMDNLNKLSWTTNDHGISCSRCRTYTNHPHLGNHLVSCPVLRSILNCPNEQDVALRHLLIGAEQSSESSEPIPYTRLMELLSELNHHSWQLEPLLDERLPPMYRCSQCKILATNQRIDNHAISCPLLHLIVDHRSLQRSTLSQTVSDFSRRQMTAREEGLWRPSKRYIWAL
jgi:hypothetical protein